MPERRQASLLGGLHRRRDSNAAPHKHIHSCAGAELVWVSANSRIFVSAFSAVRARSDAALTNRQSAITFLRAA